jgi:glycosyltransferase involved in cell wall biosynthesis
MVLKVLYVLPPTKTFAGIERVVDEVGAEIARNCKDIEVDVLFTTNYPDVPRNREYNRLLELASGRIELLMRIRRSIERKDYDLVIVPQVEATVLIWLACAGLGRRFVLHLHGNPAFERGHFKAKVLFFLMRTLLVRRLAGVLGTSPRQLEAFRRSFPNPAPHFWVPNPVRRFDGAARAWREPTPITFVKVGRFSYQKGHDLLLRAFARVCETRKDVRLLLVGYGVEEPNLRAQISALGLEDAVRIEHQPHDPSPALETADVYVSASRWEGWSLAICEALRFGLPVVATDCDFGPSDILVDARLGRLTPPQDERALADAMLYYCDNLRAEQDFADFRKAYVERFDASKVVHAHAEALRAISRARRSPTRVRERRAPEGHGQFAPRQSTHEA